MNSPNSQRWDEIRNGKRNHSFGLRALFLIIAMCVVLWSIIGALGGGVIAYALSFISLGFLTYCIVSVASGNFILETKMALSAAVVFMCLTLIFSK